jgi:DNA-binding response OmpR family regulator
VFLPTKMAEVSSGSKYLSNDILLAMAKVLIVEDDTATSSEIAEVLTLDNHTIENTDNGTIALGLLEISRFDLIILDWSLHGQSGLEVLEQFRKAGGATPILMLTGRNQITDKEQGFDAGADDYLTKPFHIKELRARVKALLRRGRELTDDRIEFRHIVLDIPAQRVFIDEQEVQLMAREFALLALLLKNRERIFSLDALISSVWASDEDVTHDAVRQCVTRIRKKIDRQGEPSIITTLAGQGYKIEK